MHGLVLAQRMYSDTVTKTRGQKFSRVATQLNEKAMKIRQAGESADPQDDVRDVLDDMTADNREGIDGVFDPNNVSRQEQAQAAEDAAKHLDTGAEDIREATKKADMTNEEKGGNTVAQAVLSESGTQSGDPLKMTGKNTVVNKDVATGAVIHETEHAEKQKVQTVDRVSATSDVAEEVPVSNTLDEAPKKGEMTSTQLTEAGAVAVQLQAASKSKETLDTIYKDTYEYVRSVVGSDQRIIELARQEDGLEQVGEMMASSKA